MTTLEDIDEQISSLSFLDRIIFNSVLTESLSNSKWCKSQGLDPSSPDIKRAKEILYSKLGFDENSSLSDNVYSPHAISGFPY